MYVVTTHVKSFFYNENVQKLESPVHKMSATAGDTNGDDDGDACPAAKWTSRNAWNAM
jgi:hypothetical protein